jgi:hypothetical protein
MKRNQYFRFLTVHDTVDFATTIKVARGEEGDVSLSFSFISGISENNSNLSHINHQARLVHTLGKFGPVNNTIINHPVIISGDQRRK